MEYISGFVFLLLTLCLLVLSFCESARKRVLAVSAVNEFERRLDFLDRHYGWVFAAVMALGVFVRCYRFVELPLGINQDGLMAGTEAYSLLMNGTDQFGTSWPTYFSAWGFSQMSTLYSWLLIPFIKILGLSKFTLRLPMLLVSIAMMPLIWDFTRRMLGKGYALLVLFLVAANPWHMLQSRWALEANLMPHVLLTGVYLMYLGRHKRWALYLSMLFFGLTPYAYGVACFSVPLLLVFSAIYYFARKKANVFDILVCVMIFAGVAGLYFYTMLINSLGWDSVQLGPITLPYFPDSLRSRDMIFMQENPYHAMCWNLFGHLGTWLFAQPDGAYNVVDWTHTLYRFMPPVVVCGVYILWSDRRAIAAAQKESPFRDGGMLLLIWLFVAVFNGAMIGGVVNRNNVVFYPLLMFGAYAIYQMGRRIKLGAAGVLLMVMVSFVGMNVTYFTDQNYQKSVGDYFKHGLYEALTDTWGWDYDQYYVDTDGDEDGPEHKLMRAYVMFAHQIDYRGRNEDILLKNQAGEEIDWYFGERYVFADIEELEPDPMECAVYVVRKENKTLFDPQEYRIVDYGNYAAVYPLYWIE